MQEALFMRDLAVLLAAAGTAGWICHRLGLAVVVGYVLAGILIGPHSPLFPLVADTDRVHTLGEMGLIFLVFSIGLNLGLDKIRRLGVSLVVATILSALLVYQGGRLLALCFGWSRMEGLFLAAMLMVSSSAIIGKVLHDLRRLHEPPSQSALGMTVLEDIVAVVMLTVLGSMVAGEGQGEAASMVRIVTMMASFILVLVLASLMVVPRLFGHLSRVGNVELRTLALIGLLTFLAWGATRAGYSMALGPFLLGVIVASTPHKPEAEKVFQGLRDLFGAVFFAAMGMLFDVRLLSDTWMWVLAVAAFAVLFRAASCALGLVLSGRRPADALAAGLILTPIGEFSFVMAQVGVVAGVLPGFFYAMALATSILTTLTAPLLIGRSAGMGRVLEARIPSWVRGWISVYHAWLERLQSRGQRSLLWRRAGRRLVETIVLTLLMSALLAWAGDIYRWVASHVAEYWPWAEKVMPLFWIAYGMLLLVPLMAVWRNIDVLAMILAEAATDPGTPGRPSRTIIQVGLRILAVLLLVEWLLAFLPVTAPFLWVELAIGTILVGLAVIFRKRLTYWHSLAEQAVGDRLRTALDRDGTIRLESALREQLRHVSLRLEELLLPERAASAGRSLAQLDLRRRHGCMVAVIDRQGCLIHHPSGAERLYPGDKLLLLGTPEQLAAVRPMFEATKLQLAEDSFAEVTAWSFTLSEATPCLGARIDQLTAIRALGVQIVALWRQGRLLFPPSADEILQSQDELVLLGTTHAMRRFREWLLMQPAPGADPTPRPSGPSSDSNQDRG